MAHNRLIDEGHSFTAAQRMLQHHYQYATVHDYLPHIVGRDVVRRLLRGRRFRCDRKVRRQQRLRRGTGRGVRRRSHCLYLRGSRRSPMTPVEFSVAAFRFGHSQVRSAYALNDQTGRIPVFSLTAPDLRGGRPLPAGRQIDWGNFFEELDSNRTGFNVSRRIDPLISASLFALPIPGSEASGSNVLAFRNMLRAKFYDLPSGQRVARAMRERVITPRQLNLGPGFERGTPLWYYVLAEAKRREDGLRLGPVGRRIVAEVFLSVLDADRASYLHRRFRPDRRFVGMDRKLTVSDLFEFARVAEPLQKRVWSRSDEVVVHVERRADARSWRLRGGHQYPNVRGRTSSKWDPSGCVQWHRRCPNPTGCQAPRSYSRWTRSARRRLGSQGADFRRTGRLV